MNFNSTAGSYGLAAMLAVDLYAKQSLASLETRRQAIIDSFRLPFTAQDYVQNNGLLAYTVFQNPNLTVVTILGVQGRASALALNRSYATNPDSLGSPSCSPFFRDNAMNIWGGLVLSGANVDGQLIVGGYSAGGATGQALAAYWKQQRNGSSAKSIAFGSPFSGGATFVRQMQLIDSVRYINFGDPVSVVPFHAGVGPTARFLADPAVKASWDRYINVNDGLVTYSDGTILPEFLPVINVNFADFTLLSFLLSNDSQATAAHALSLYGRRAVILAQTANDYGYTADAPQPPFRERLEPPFRAGLDDQPAPVVRRQLEVLAETRRAQPQPPPPYKYRLVQGSHAVVASDLVVDLFPSKRSAKNFAKRMNAAVKYWDNSLAGDAKAFAQSVNDNFPGEL